MASQRIDIWSENTPQQISVNSEKSPQSIKVKDSTITVLDNNYDNIANKPSINGVTLEGNKTSRDLGLTRETDRLSKEIKDLNSSLSTVSKTGSYDDLSEKPSINGVTLTGNISSDDLHILAGSAEWGQILGQINNQTDLRNALASKVPTDRTINGKALTEDITLTAEDVGASANITYTGTTIDNRVVTQETVTEPVQGTKPIGSYGPFNYIPIDMSHYTAGSGNKALRPEDHLPAGAYVVTVPGYMRLGTETKLMSPGHIIFWDPESGELDLLGYNACEYWSYDSQNDSWEGGYFTTSSDVEYMIEEKIPDWTKISNGLFIVATKDPGYYTFNYSSASGTTRRIRIDVEGTNEHYYPYNDTILIKSETGVIMLGRYNLWFAYDSTNNYYKQPVDFTTIQSQLDALDARITALGG